MVQQSEICEADGYLGGCRRQLEGAGAHSKEVMQSLLLRLLLGKQRAAGCSACAATAAACQHHERLLQSPRRRGAYATWGSLSGLTCQCTARQMQRLLGVAAMPAATLPLAAASCFLHLARWRGPWRYAVHRPAPRRNRPFETQVRQARRAMAVAVAVPLPNPHAELGPQLAALPVQLMLPHF